MKIALLSKVKPRYWKNISLNSLKYRFQNKKSYSIINYNKPNLTDLEKIDFHDLRFSCGIIAQNCHTIMFCLTYYNVYAFMCLSFMNCVYFVYHSVMERKIKKNIANKKTLEPDTKCDILQNNQN